MKLFNKKVLAEFLGTAVFLTSIVGANAAGSPLRQASLAITLALMILLFGSVSGAHFNPVVSTYFYATRAINLGSLISFILAQLAGAAAGAWVGITIWGGKLSYGGSAAPNLLPQLGGEVLATAGLVALIAQLVRTKNQHLIWAAVGLWVFAAGTFTQTGAQANPAVSFALLFAGHAFADQSLLIIAQFLGMLIAVIVVLLINAPEKKNARPSAAKAPARTTAARTPEGSTAPKK